MEHSHPLAARRCLEAAFVVVVVICSVLGCPLTTCVAAPRRSTPATTATSEPKYVSLRADSPVLLQSSRGGAGGVALLVSVAVVNRSAESAKGVVVYLTLRGGLTIPLRGPKAIGAFGKVVYVSSQRLPTPVTETPKVVISCLNCQSHR